MSNRRNHPTARRYPVCTYIVINPYGGNRYGFEEFELTDENCVECFERFGRITDHKDREDSCVLDEDGPF